MIIAGLHGPQKASPFLHPLRPALSRVGRLALGERQGTPWTGR